MKKVLLLCFLMVGFKAFDQDAAPLKDGKVFYEKVIPVAGKDKDFIYSLLLVLAVLHNKY